MPTIKDIAREAGVSHATVSNVLNNKGNVSSKKIELVRDAARKLGYRPNEAASSLRAGGARLLAVILPGLSLSGYREIYEALAREARKRDYGILLRTTDDNRELEKKATDDVLASRATLCAAVDSLSQTDGDYPRLLEAGVRLLMIGSEREERPSVLLDMESAGREMALRAAKDGAVFVALMTGLYAYADSRVFAAAFEKAFLEACPGGRVQRVESPAAQAEKRAFAFFEDGCEPDAIVADCEELAQAALCVTRVTHPEKMPRIYTLSPSRPLQDERFIRYEMPFARLGAHMARALFDDKAPQHELLEGDGFKPCPSPALKKRARLNMLAIANPSTLALKSLLPALKADTGIELSMSFLPSSEVSAVLSRSGDVNDFDMVRMDLALMDYAAQTVLERLDKLPFDLNDVMGRMLPGLEKEYSLVDGEPRALPFDPSVHLLFYRKGLFEDAGVKRSYYERTREALRPPLSFEEYVRVARFFTRRLNRSSPTEYGTLLVRRASEWIMHFVALSKDGALNDLTDPVYFEALNQRKALEEAAAVCRDGRWDAAARQFACGDYAMMIAYANYAEAIAGAPLSGPAGPIGFARVPGGMPILGGGVLGVTRFTPRREEAAEFITWLYSDRVLTLLSLLSGCSPAKCAYESEAVLRVYPWFPMVRDGLKRGVRRGIFCRCSPPFDQLLLETQIAFQCQNAVAGVLPMDKALEHAQEIYLQAQKR